jgi:hypothetical protein
VISSYNSKSTEKINQLATHQPFTNQFTWGFVHVLMVKSDFLERWNDWIFQGQVGSE